jgi:hypothetical protein
MKNPITGQAQPIVSELDQKVLEKPKRVYKTPDGAQFEITEDEFEQIVAIFEFLRQSRDEKSTQPDIEPEGSSTQSTPNPLLLRKAG